MDCAVLALLLQEIIRLYVDRSSRRQRGLLPALVQKPAEDHRYTPFARIIPLRSVICAILSPQKYDVLEEKYTVTSLISNVNGDEILDGIYGRTNWGTKISRTRIVMMQVRRHAAASSRSSDMILYSTWSDGKAFDRHNLISNEFEV